MKKLNVRRVARPIRIMVIQNWMETGRHRLRQDEPKLLKEEGEIERQRAEQRRTCERAANGRGKRAGGNKDHAITNGPIRESL
ncbi:MAG: hypothetical protein ABW184_00380 [Sphingobium sp.]